MTLRPVFIVGAAILGAAVLSSAACGSTSNAAQEPQTETNIATVKRFVADVKERRNPETADEVLHADFQSHFPIPGLPPGRAGFEAVRKILGAAFNDVRVETQFFVASGDMVVERSHASAMHIGEFLGAPATNRRVQWTETHIYRFTGGKIIEHWPELNLLGVMHQIREPSGP